MNSNYILPITIVIAGALIAGGIFWSGKSGAGMGNNTDGTQTVRAYEAGVDHILGNPNARVKVVEYIDLECQHCKIFHTTMHQIMDYYGSSGNVAWVVRHFPLASIHPKATQEAAAAECAAAQGGDQAFFAFIDKVFEVTPSNNGLDLNQLPAIAESVGLNAEVLRACLSAGTYTEKVAASYTEAIEAGGEGTPYTLIMVDGELIPGGNLSGAQSYASMRAALDAILQQLGTPVVPPAVNGTTTVQ
ncbi:thioredoxin domain-containing protein [Candidatus Nomurabacteria bacterium]|nr:thioredoxin domain-containing protein [Candidatus Nomurabacteria bacterium]